MTGFSTCTLRAAQVLAVLLCVSVPTARCDDGASEGIDFVLLVDVSRSMVQSSKERGAKHPELILETDGSDPERIRWDAAKLLLDLLGPGDRLMVCRFNHGCPPIFNNSGVTPDNENLLREMKKYPFFEPWSSDFKKSFSWLTDASRKDLANDINKFNRTDDVILPKEGQPIVTADGKVYGGIGYLDVGGTRIVSALKEVETWVRARDPGPFSPRPVHVIVLTDGRDDELDNENSELRDEVKLRNRLRFYTGDSVAGIAPGGKIHCIGLNLKSENSKEKPERAEEARSLLKRIARETGGAFDEVDDSEHLMQFFLCLTKRLRRYWVEEIPFPGGDIPSQPHAKTLVANGLSELSVLSYRRAAKPSRKYAIEPTPSEPKFDWIGPGERKPEAEDVRTGKDGRHYKDGTLYKNGSLYRCYYFGPQVDSDGVTGSSPFSKFQDPITLKITVPPSETDQRLVLLKGTVQPLFRLTSPVAEPPYQRYEKLTVRVDMLSKEHFSPRGFQLSATIRPFGERKSDATADGIGQSGMSCHSATPGPQEPGQETTQTVQLKPVESGNGQTVFEGEVLLAGLPRGPKPRPIDDIDDYEIQVTAVGLRSEPPHALSGTTFELLPRIFRVANKLLLKPVDPLELSTDPGGDVCEFEVEAIGPAGRANRQFGDVPLTLEFIPPQTKLVDKLVPVPLKHFRVTPPGNGPRQLVLKDGRAKVRIALDADLPDRNAKYEQGAFVVTNADGVRMEPLRVPVKLRLDLAKVQFKAAPSEIIAKPVEVRSEPITVIIDPQKKRDKESSNKEVTVTLRFLGPADKTKEDPSNFGESELWLEKVGDAAETPKRTRTIQVKVGDNDQMGDAFRVHLEPRGDKTPGKYRCRLEVDGSWIDSATHDFDLNKDAAAIMVAIPGDPLPIGRGLSRPITCKAWLQGLPGETAAVHVGGLRLGEAVLFKRKGANDGGHRFPVVCNPSTPVVVQSLNTAGANQLAKRSNLDFVISVPEDTPYGEYSTELTLVGPNVSSQKFQINVVVDGLEFDVLQPSLDPNSPGQWQSVSTKPLVQLRRTSMKKTLRVRTGLGEPLDKDEIAIGLVGEFKSNSGDVVQGRLANGRDVTGIVGISKIRLDDKRQTAEFDVEFPSTPNRNDEGSPYILKLFAKPASVGVPAKKWFVKDIHFEFQVRYLDKKEIVEVRIVPAEPGAGK